MEIIYQDILEENVLERTEGKDRQTRRKKGNKTKGCKRNRKAKRKCVCERESESWENMDVLTRQQAQTYSQNKSTCNK